MASDLSHLNVAPPIPTPPVCGNNGFAYSYAEAPNGDIYIGGAFTTANGTTVNRIARWDGTSWQSLGSGMNDIVYALAFAPNGDLYAGGGFTTAGGVPANYIAKWDGSAWQAIGGGTNATIHTIAFKNNGDLFVGGQFTGAGGNLADYIAKYSNGNWQSLHSGMDNWVQTIAISPSNQVYVGGKFMTVNGMSTSIALWDGNSWQNVGSGVNREVKNMAFAPNGDLYAGGAFTIAGGVPAVRIAKWDGNSWSPLAGGVNSTVTSINFLGNQVYVGGNFNEVDGIPMNYVARWENGIWSDVGGGTDGAVFGLAVTSAGRLIVGGLFNTAGATATQNIAQWDGSSWSGLCAPCVCSGPVTLTNQAEVDAFCCTGAFSGNLTIGPSTDITDLSPLNGITSISNALRIQHNGALQTLSGLENLAATQLLIIENNALLDVNGLNNLTSVQNGISLIDNDQLVDLSALSQADLGPTGSLSLLNNSSLPTLTGLEGITHARAVTIENNDALIDLNGLQNLDDVDLWVRVINNGVQNLNGLQGLISIGDDLNIEQNHQLVNMNALSSLAVVTGDLIIRNNLNLTNVDGLSGVTAVENLSVISNAALTNLNGFINLQTVGMGLRVISNANLQSCCGIYTALNNGPPTVVISGNPGCATSNDILNGCGDQDGDGFTTAQGDCDDGNPDVYPGAVEICNGLDDDCDQMVDEDETPPNAICTTTSQTVLDFDHLLFNDNQRHFYSTLHEDGFTLSQQIPAQFPQNGDNLVIHGTLSGFWWKGSPAVWFTLASNPPTYALVTKDDGGLFDLHSLSVATQIGSSVPQSFTVEGVKADASVVSQSFVSQSATQLVPFALNNDFRDLVAFRWSIASDGAFQVDDIVISTGNPIELVLNENGEAQLDPVVVNGGSFDACGSVNLALSQTNFSCDHLGLNSIDLIVTDQAGNSSTCSVTINVQDNLPPTFIGSLPIDISADCQSIPEVPLITANDNCSAAINFSQSCDFDGICSDYQITRTWVATDPSGNSVSHMQIITVTDQLAPVFNEPLPGDLIVECGSVPAAAVLTAVDDCSGTPNYTEFDPSSDPSLAISGTIGSVNMAISLTDVTTAEMKFLANTTDNSFSTFANPFFTPSIPLADGAAFNAISGVGTITFDFATPISNPVLQIANIDLSVWDFSATTLNLVRLSGNDQFGVADGQIFDTDPATFGGFDSGFGSVQFLGTFTQITGTISKLDVGTDGLIFQMVAGDPKVPVDFNEVEASGICEGTYTITRTWQAQDGCGNSVEHSQTIEVADNTAPGITECPLDISVENDASLCGAVVTWSDPQGVDVCSQVTVSSTHQSGDFFPVGTTPVSYVFSDACGNSSTCIFNVTVADAAFPVPDVANLPDLDGCEVTVSTPTATDNCDGIIQGSTLDPTFYNSLGTYTIHWTYEDAAGNVAMQNQLVIVEDDIDPEITSVSVPLDPIVLGNNFATSGTFTDDCDKDDHSAVWDWGDGTASNGTVDHTTHIVGGDHTYAEPGVYIITLTVSDGSGNSDVFVATTYAVIYDPSDGFITGGGWIQSPPGAYVADPNLTGKANFGFVSKYKNGANIPTGNTSFHLNVANFKFKSTEYDWLVIAGANAKFKGSGEVNNQGEYGFMITGIDGQVNGGGGTDKFRIKIWDKNNGHSVVYDNKMGSDDTSYDTQELGGGSITIHKENGNYRLTLNENKFFIENEIQLNVFPNPSRGLVNFEIIMPKSAEGNIQIFNVDGRMVRDLGKYKYTKGNNVSSWDGENGSGNPAPPGFYYIVCKAGDQMIYQPLIRL